MTSEDRPTTEKRDPERYARESFTMRRPERWQTWLLTIVLAIAAISLVAYGISMA